MKCAKVCYAIHRMEVEVIIKNKQVALKVTVSIRNQANQTQFVQYSICIANYIAKCNGQWYSYHKHVSPQIKN